MICTMKFTLCRATAIDRERDIKNLCQICGFEFSDNVITYAEKPVTCGHSPDT